MPAEWAPHEATWLSWPHNRDTWPGCFDGVEPAMAETAAALAEVEKVYINVLNAEHEAHVRRLLDPLVPPEQVQYFHIPTNDAWVRDHGPIFATRAGDATRRGDATRTGDDSRTGGATRTGDDPRLALDFDYNAWGGKYPPYDLDRKAGGRMAEAIGVPRAAWDVVLEGGAIDVNGAGALLTTEQCLLNPNRNPSMSRAEIEAVLSDAFGVAEIIWLGEGIVGDDTDGHIDDLTRFVAERTVVTVVEPNRADANHAPLAENRKRLADVTIGGQPLEVIELPMPDPLYNGDERLPASYANFYIANDRVLLPVFACPQDDIARDALSACFPDRRIVPIDCRALVGGLGALHCLTQQVPAVTAG